MPTKPNIVIVVPHDTGQFISPYGYDTVTSPNSERLASEGVLFKNHFCTSPLCSPARAAMLTGRYTHQNGVHGLVGRDTVGGWNLADCEGERHLVSYLKEAGYQSVLIGGMHEAKQPDRLGFDSHDWNGDIRMTPPTMDEWLEARDTDRPFYIQVGSHETHRSWTVNDTLPDDSNGIWIPPFLKESDELKSEMAEMQGAAKRYDEGIGGMLDALDKHGCVENTIFISTTDHGIDIPRAKGTFYDPGIETLMLMRYPDGGWGKGRVIEELASHIDLVPTLLEAAGIDLPDNLAGRSCLPLLEGKEYTENEYVFAEKTFHDTYDPTRAVRSKRYKYIRFFEVCIFTDLRLATIPRVHMFKGDDRAFVRRTVDELYDLEHDPHELTNLSEDPEYGDIKKQMSGVLAQWMKDTDDPLIHGPIQSPFYKAQMEEFLGA